MGIHIAIVQPRYEKLIVSGHKTIECRLTKLPKPPFGCAAPGQVIHFKRSGGPFFAKAVVDQVWSTDRLDQDLLNDIRTQWNDLIHGTDEFFQLHATCRHATLIWIRELALSAEQPTYKPQNMRAWYYVDEGTGETSAGEISHAYSTEGFEITLTGGALTQGTMRVTDCMDRFPEDSLGGATKTHRGREIALDLEGIQIVLTDIVKSKKIFRWRGWSRWLKEHRLQPGDRLRFTPSGDRVYRVDAVPS